MFDDLATSSMAGCWTNDNSLPTSADDLIAMQKKLEAIKPKFDGFAFTYKQWADVRREYDIINVGPLEFTHIDRLFGLPVWLFADEINCLGYAIEYWAKYKKKIAFIKGSDLVTILDWGFTTHESWLDSARSQYFRSF